MSNFFAVGSANAASGTTLTVPVTSGTTPGNSLFAAAACTAAHPNTVTDSTGGNNWVFQRSDNVEGFNEYVYQGIGISSIGATVTTGTYSDQTTMVGTGTEFDGYAGRPLAHQAMKVFYISTTLGNSVGFPANSTADTRYNLANLVSNGYGKFVVCCDVAVDTTNAYTGSTYTTEKTNLTNFMTYLNTLGVPVVVTLWNEFNDTKKPFVADFTTESARKAAFLAMWNFYAPVITGAGITLGYCPAWNSGPNSIQMQRAISWFPTTNTPQQMTGDLYCNNYDQGITFTTVPTGQTDSIQSLADAHGIPIGVWETGYSANPTNPSSTQVVAFLQYLQNYWTTRLAAGKPMGDIVWFGVAGGTPNGNTLSASTPPSVIAAIQSLNDAVNGATCALQSGGTVTVTFGSSSGAKVAGVIAATPDASINHDIRVQGDSASTTTPSITSGTLAQANELAIAISATANASGSPTWGGSWTPLLTVVNGSASPYLSMAAQLTSSASALTASNAISPAGAAQMILLTYPLDTVNVNAGALAARKPAMSGTGTVSSPAGNITGTGGLTLPKPRMASGGLGAPGTPYLVGSLNASALSGTINVATPVSSGDSIQVGVTVSGVTSVASVGPDSAGNAYTQILSDVTNGTATLFVFECDGANPLTAGVDTIPVSQTVNGQLGAFAIGDNGVFAGDKAVIAHGSSASPSSGSTGTLSQIEEHSIAWIASQGSGGSPAWASPWSSHVLATQQTNTTGTWLTASYQQVTVTTALTASGSITSAPWASACTTLEVAPNQVTLTPSNGIVGVPYSQKLESSGGDPPAAFSITGSLPPGLSLASGVLAGIPTTAGSYTFTIVVTDSLGQTASLIVTVVILAATAGNGIIFPGPNNLLTPADADFEVPGFTWAAQANAAAPQVTNAVAFTGGAALGWASLADGPTAISPTACNVTGGAGYIFSGAVFALNPSVTCALSVIWLDVNNNILETDAGPVISMAANGWAPVHGAFTAPAGAVQAVPVVTVGQSNAGDVTFIDGMFFAQASSQVLVDWVNGPFSGSAGAAFMDVSPWIRLDGNGVTYTLGRQDAISEIQPSSGSFELQNDLGEFANDSADSLPVIAGGDVTLHGRTQINRTDENGIWSTRFDGIISEIDYETEVTGNTSIATVALTDILSELNRQDSLSCWTEEQVLSDGPLYHWALSDAGTLGGAGVAAETSGNNGPAMRLVSSDSTSTATITWQDTSGGVETLADAASATGADGSEYWTAGSNQPNTPLRGLDSGHVGPFTTPVGSALFTPKQTPQSAQNTFIGGTGYQLVAELPVPLAPTATGSDFSVELWFMPDPSLATGLSLNNGPYIALGLGSSLTKTNLLAGIFLNAGTATIKCQNYSQPPAFLGLNWPGAATPSPVSSTSASWTPDTVKRPHHMVVAVQGDPSAPAVRMWIDGQQVGSGFTLPKGQIYDTICIGGAYGGCGAFFGNISLASVYPYLLSSQQITNHCMLGQYGMWEQTTDDCIAALAQFANIPGYWTGVTAQHAGLTMAEYLDISNANAVAAMQQFENAERGLLYVGNDGTLNFHTRSWRMGYGAPDVLLPPDVFSPDLQYKIIDQFMCNEEGISGPNTLGANSTTLLANPLTGATQTQTAASSVIQAGFINPDSQARHGTYAQNPVNSPLSLPLVAWSRGFAALGLPQYAYSPDPNLSDRAAWDANSRAEPWALPASVTIDLLTLDPNTGLAISSLYALGVDNMIAPSPDTLPPSFPGAQTSVEWFIEGITETFTASSHTIEFYTSPAEPQRAWIPGDAAYGVLGSTTRLGISTSDAATVQAYGKDVAHDAGGPYWPPTFSAFMNQESGQLSFPLPAPRGFVGASDMRGIAGNLQAMLQPPICVVGTVSETQSFTNGSLSGTSPPNVATLYWDQLFVDTTGGMGAIPGWPNWYLVTQAGYYEVDALVTWSATASALGFTGQGWIVVAQSAAQALAAGTGTPLTVNQYVCPVGEAVCFNSTSMTPVCAASARMYLGVGDMVCVAAEHNLASAKSTSTAGAGSMMSLRFAGLATNDDRTLINTSIATGGGVSLVSHGPIQQSVFFNTHTYAYQGANGNTPYARINSDLNCLQGYQPQPPHVTKNNGSRSSQIAFNTSAIISALTGHTILSATLTATNVSGYSQNPGARALIGWTSDTPGKATFNAQDHNTTSWVTTEWFQTGATKTFSIPISLVQALKLNGGTALVLGNSTITSDTSDFGAWQGGPASWTLTVNYR